MLLGRVALKALDLQDGTADLAYWMVAAARDQGLCTTSVIALCQWAFSAAGLATRRRVVSPPKQAFARKVPGAAPRCMLTGGMTCTCTHS